MDICYIYISAHPCASRHDSDTTSRLRFHDNCQETGKYILIKNLIFSLRISNLLYFWFSYTINWKNHGEGSLDAWRVKIANQCFDFENPN